MDVPAAVKRKGRGFGGAFGSGLKPLTQRIKANKSPTRSSPKQSSPTSETPPSSASAEGTKPKTDRDESRDAVHGKLIISLNAGKNLALTAKSRPYLLCSYESNYSSSSQPIAYEDGISHFSDPIWNHTAEFDVTEAEEDQAIEIMLFDNVLSRAKGEDPLLGKASIHLTPTKLKEGLHTDHFPTLLSENGIPFGGHVHLTVTYYRNQSFVRLKPEDFKILKRIGTGSFGVVYKVRKIDSGRLYAMKVLSKAAIAKSKSAAHVVSEKDILKRAHIRRTPFLVGLKFSFQTETNLYFVMELKSGGELFSHLQRDGGRWDESRVVFYAAEILLGLEALHHENIVYRDLKPENVLLDAAGHVSLCDFGLSKTLESGKKTRTFCGTADYLSPEVIQNSEDGYNKTIDWWSLGILIYEMLTGYPPFIHEDRMEKYKLIVSAELKFPKRGISDDARSILKQLLNPSPTTRLGAKGPFEIKEHPFFSSIDWEALAARRVTPPYKPSLSEGDSPSLSPYVIQEALPPAATPSLSDGDESGSFTSSGGGEAKKEPPMSRRSSCQGTRAEEDDDEEYRSRDWWRDFSFATPESGRSSSVSVAPHGVSDLKRGLSMTRAH